MPPRTPSSERSRAVPIEELRSRLEARSEDRPFKEALVRPGVSVICEFKRRSPSAGDIRAGAEVAEIVGAYERGGAAALSIVTESSSFGGSVEDLLAAWESSDLPVLRKDFVVDSYQLVEAAVYGADAVLLIVAALDPNHLADLHAEAQSLDLDTLVEVHDEEDLEVALELGVDVIGINNRDLRSLKVDLATTEELITDVPAGKTVVAESGLLEPRADRRARADRRRRRPDRRGDHGLSRPRAGRPRPLRRRHAHARARDPAVAACESAPVSAPRVGLHAREGSRPTPCHPCTRCGSSSAA